MSILIEATAAEKVEGFTRGVDQESPPMALPRGGYAAAQNILLGVDGGKRWPATLKLDATLDANAGWPTGINVRWFQPFTYSTYAAGVLTFTTELWVAYDNGAVYRYQTGTPTGSVTLARRGFNTSAALWTHAIYDRYLVTMNGVDAPMKVNQHFQFGDAGTANSQNEPTPYMFPLGAKPISPCGPALTGEAWTHGGTGAFIADASVPNGGSRVGTQTLRVAANQNSFNSWTQTKNFTLAPEPYGGSDFAGTDFFQFRYLKPAASAGTLVFRFGNDANTIYFEFTIAAGSMTGDNTWRLVSAQRSLAVATGAADWATIKRMTVFNNDAQVIYVDDCYFLYATAPPALQVGTYHKGRIVGGGVPVAADDQESALGSVYWSRADFPDEFPAANAQVLPGGQVGLARTNQILALRDYQDSVIIGFPNAIVAWTVSAANNVPTRSLITGEFGIDSHRAFVETPTGSLMFTWQRGVYILRSTGKSYISGKIADILSAIWLEEPWWTVGVMDEQTKTLRFWFRTTTSQARTAQGVIYDVVQAQNEGEPVWVGTMTQMADFATPVYVNGVRETLYSRNNSNLISRMHITASGTITSSVTLGWMSRLDKDGTVKWAGLYVPYRSTVDIGVDIRYANNPHEFDGAVFEAASPTVLAASPTITSRAQVNFGQTSRYAQVRLQATTYGFEIFPPVKMYTFEEKKVT